MADNQQGGDFERKVYKGEWKCGNCGNPITELPFEPDSERLDQLLCRDCYRNRRQERGY